MHHSPTHGRKIALNVRRGDPILGSTLDDRYQIVRRIARGGMATVFEATDLRLSRTVAVKIMHPGLDEDGDIASRFDTEARAAALLSHPNVVAVFDQGHDDGRPYIVMEYVRGITLRQLITLEAPFPTVQALELFEPVVAALAAAHAAGIIHRDVKPENVLISTDGHIKVADFGLARDVTAASVAEGGVVIGTVSYIAPELVSRGQASTRSDVYSLGILLYELLTGVKPHRGATPLEIAYAHVHRPVPVPSAAPRTAEPVPDYLDALVRTTTIRTPARRQTDAGVLLDQVRGARTAATHGVPDSGALLALMTASTRHGVDQARESLPELVTAAPRSAVSASSVDSREAASTPEAARWLPRLRELRLARLGSPSSPGIPDADASARPAPISPYSPPSRPQVITPSQWVQSPLHRRRRLVAAVASVIVVGTLLLGTWWATAGRLPAVPAVKGLEQPGARTALAEAGLAATFVREYSETVPPGIVLRTDPASGAHLAPDSVVIVYLSQGAQLYDVPLLKGKTRDQALGALADARLVAGAITEAYDPKVPAGTVLSQATPAGTALHRGSGVDFVLSKGIEPVDLADWSGKPAADAKAALIGAGLKVKTTEAISPTVAKGGVVSQSPAPGQVHKGDTVALVISKGPAQVVVPDVRKLDAAAATAKLESAGFTVTTAPSPTKAGVPGTVVSTDPASGRRVDAGSPVTIFIG